MRAFAKGLGFGVTSGIVTTLGIIVGLSASTETKSVVLGGIMTIALADSLSDAFGIHIAEESASSSAIEVWTASAYTFIFKAISTLSLAVPFFFFALDMAVIISILWGILLLAIFSLALAHRSKEGYIKVIIEHLSIALMVLASTQVLGVWIKGNFG